ncbi:MAG TPA: phage tail protein [Acidimicrobiales bacterium]|nr:phage tail protein [Acidimicrobiales bacterium]
MSEEEYLDQGVTGEGFLLEVDGVEIGRFVEVEGLQVTIDVVTVAEGGQNGFVHKFPGRMTWPDLVFKRGLTKSDSLLDWINKVAGDGFAGAGNKVTRNTAAVTVLDAAGNRLRSWEVEGAFPVQWSGPRFSVDNGGLPEEQLVVTHHGFKASTKG